MSEEGHTEGRSRADVIVDLRLFGMLQLFPEPS